MLIPQVQKPKYSGINLIIIMIADALAPLCNHAITNHGVDHLTTHY